MQAPLSRLLKAALCGLLLLALPAQAAVRLQVEGVSGRLEENVRAHIGQPPRENAAAARAFQRRAAQDAERGLRALGYYNPEISVRREPVGDEIVVTVTIDPGPRVEITTVDIRFLGDAADDPEFLELLERLPIREGRGLHHGEYEAAKRAIQNLALRRGYFDGIYRQQRVAVDMVDNVATITLHFDSGPRYHLGEVRFPETPFTEDLLQRLVPFAPGDPYEAGLVGRFNRNLLDSRYFQEARVLPLHEEAENHRIPVEVELVERSPNLIGVGAGISTDTGPRLRLTWDRAWVNRYGHKAHADVEIAQVRQALSTRYIVPLEDPIDDILEFQTGFRLEEFGEDTDSERFTASVQRQQYLGSGWRRTFSLRWERERFIEPVAEEIGTTTSELFLPGFGFTRTRSRGGIDPYWGDRQLYNIEATHQLLGSDTALARLRMGQRWLRPFGERHRLILRADGGILFDEDFAAVPPSLRFYAGGDQSVRGFGYQELGPGRYLLVGSAEYGYQLRENWRLAAFVDGGNAVLDLDDGFEVGAGFGVHWISPVGPVRLDLAWPVSKDPVPTWPRLHFSLGAQL